MNREKLERLRDWVADEMLARAEALFTHHEKAVDQRAELQTFVAYHTFACQHLNSLTKVDVAAKRNDELRRALAHVRRLSEVVDPLNCDLVEAIVLLNNLQRETDSGETA